MRREIPIERKALFNLIRMQWLQDSSLEVDLWQVEDLSQLSMDQLFNRLQEQEIWLDPVAFTTKGSRVSSPEELTDSLVGQRVEEDFEPDAIYLVVFEIWRRLFPDRLVLSVVCDRLDGLIWDYDHQGEMDLDKIKDCLEALEGFLAAGVEGGLSSRESFVFVSAYCANDLESFLFDFAAELIDAGEIEYARHLLEVFYHYIQDRKWFDLLEAELVSIHDEKAGESRIRLLLCEALGIRDIDFAFELLHLSVEVGSEALFVDVVKLVFGLIHYQDQFHELLDLSCEFYQRRDREKEALEIEKMLESQSMRDSSAPFDAKSAHAQAFLAILEP